MTNVFIKLKHFGILLVCFLYFLIRGKADKKKNNLSKFLVVQFASLGDMVCTTQVFRAIKNKYPQSNVVVVGNYVNKELLANNKDVNEYIVYQNNFWHMVRKLRSGEIDFACVTSPNFMGLATLYLSGIPLIVAPQIVNGTSPYQTKAYKLLLSLVKAKNHNMKSYAPREYLKLLEPVDIISNDTTKHLGFSDEAKRNIEMFFETNAFNSGDLIVGISPSSGNKIKNWPADRFAKVAEYLFDKHGAKVVITGSNNDKVEVDKLIDFLTNKNRVINALGVFSQDELKAFISKIDLFVSVDTGPIYIAEAFNVATIDIVGPVDEHVQPPIGQLHKVVKADRKNAEIYIMNSRVYDKKEALRQVNDITVDMVIKECDELLSLLKK